MAKICFYCGKELAPGERCDCRNAYSHGTSPDNGPAGASGSSGASGPTGANDRKQARSTTRIIKERERADKKRMKEQARRYRDTQKTRKPPFQWRTFLLKLMTTSGYTPTDSLPKKIGFSFLQSFIRPINAMETFVQRQDAGVSVFYLLLFCISTGLVLMRLLGFTLLVFAEGILFGLAAALIMSVLLIAVFRFLSKTRFSLMQVLSTYSAPFLFASMFFIIAAVVGGANLISFFFTILTGMVIAFLLQFLAMKALSRQASETLIANFILVYILYFSILGMILNRMVPTVTI